MCVLLVGSIPLLRHIDVHVNHLVVHSAWGIGGVVVGSGLEVKAVEEIASKGGRVGEDYLLSISGSHVPIYFAGRVNLVLNGVFQRCFLIIDFVHDLGI